MNLDLIQAGDVQRLALEGKSVTDSNPTVLLQGFSTSAKDIQTIKKE